MENEVKALNTAIAKAQSKIKSPKKTKSVDFTHEGKRTKYAYADLADVIDACRDPMAENGLSIIHQIELGDTGYYLKTTLSHAEGAFVSTIYPLPDPTKIKPQSFGSALTYARRYSYSSLIGIASDEDDDGASADKPQEVEKKSAPRQSRQDAIAQSPSHLTEKQIKRLFAIAHSKQWSNEQVKHYLGLAFKLESTKDLTKDQYDTLVTVIESSSYNHAIEECSDENPMVAEFSQAPPPEIPESDFDSFMEGPTLLDELMQFVDFNCLSVDEVKKAIQKCTNTTKKSTELNTEELNSVLKYLRLTKK